MRLLRTIVIPLVLLASVSAQENTETTFKVDVKLVNVFVTVTDEHGAPIASLKSSHLFEFRSFSLETLEKGI